LAESNVQHAIVSSESESLILVDDQDRQLGTISKSEAHDGDGLLHRAFSLFVFNHHGELLLQQRSAEKRLWPLYWSNSCCSHPRQGETMEQATHRRLHQELGISSTLNYLYRFQYQAQYLDLGSENELCSVYLGRTEDTVKVNRTEIADWCYLSFDQVNQKLLDHPEQFTPWFKLEWARISNEFLPQLSLI